MVALRNAYEASDLTYTVASAADNRDSRRNALKLTDADRRACHRPHVTEKGRLVHVQAVPERGAAPPESVTTATGAIAEKICGVREEAKNFANGSTAAPSPYSEDRPGPATARLFRSSCRRRARKR